MMAPRIRAGMTPLLVRPQRSFAALLQAGEQRSCRGRLVGNRCPQISHATSIGCLPLLGVEDSCLGLVGLKASKVRALLKICQLGFGH